MVGRIHANAGSDSGARRAWLIQVGRNKALELIRRRGINKQILEKLSEQQPHPEGRSETPADLAIQQEQARAIFNALQNLPAPQREVVRLKVYEGLTFQEIATELNIPIGTALTRMRLALQRLSEQLQTLGFKPFGEQSNDNQP